jgi:hypothetical protein
MGESFKRQLQFDGTYSNTIMICSKTDDISVTEATKSMDDEWRPKVMEIKSQIAQAGILYQEKTAAAEEQNHRIKIMDLTLKETDTRFGELAVGLLATGDDEIKVSPGKRKLSEPPLPDVKSPSLGTDTRRTSPMHETPEIMMSRSEAQVEFESLRTKKDEISKIRKGLVEELSVLLKEQKDLSIQTEGLKAEEKRQCVLFRNAYARSAVRKQFIQGIRELDQDQAIEQDAAKFDPSEELRDYKELANKLEVFSVSSRAYLKLSGKLKDDDKLTGFECKDDTEIPLLQRRAMLLADSTRASACRVFLKEFLQLFRSLVIQIVMDEAPLELEKGLKDGECRHLKAALAELRLQFESAERALWEGWKQNERCILNKMQLGVQTCHREVRDTASSWFKPKKQGGIQYSTFLALCRRKGQFAGCNGHIDLNEDVIKPLKQSFARRWERVFTEFNPGALQAHGNTCARFLREFRIDMDSRDQLKKSGRSLRAVSELVKGWEEALQDISAQKEFLTSHERQATRAMTPAIASIMASAYDQCVEEKGESHSEKL